mgnify:CR=1 FL=1
MKEIWKDILGYEGWYMVSNMGNVKSVSRTVYFKDGRIRNYPEKMIKQSIDSQGYHIAKLSKNRVVFSGLVHRLVATAFISNPQSLPEVNHKKGNKSDNRVSELEWVTASANQIHSFKVLKRQGSTKGIFGDDSGHAIKIYCPTLGVSFGSLKTAAKELGVAPSAVSFALSGKRRHAAGLTFRYLNIKS